MPKSTIAIISVIAVILIGGGAALAFAKDRPSSVGSQSTTLQNQPTTQSSQSPTTDNTATPSTAEGLTQDIVAMHNSSSDCWTIINNSVYDLTSYISQHPGGGVITQACGRDGSQLFATQGGEGQHSSQASNELSKLKIGDLQ